MLFCILGIGRLLHDMGMLGGEACGWYIYYLIQVEIARGKKKRERGTGVKALLNRPALSPLWCAILD